MWHHKCTNIIHQCCNFPIFYLAFLGLSSKEIPIIPACPPQKRQQSIETLNLLQILSQCLNVLKAKPTKTFL